MKIVEFNKEMYDRLKDKKICLVEKSMSYLDELCDNFDILSNIVAIVEENQKKYGEFVYRGIQITVHSLNYLKKIDFDETIIVVISDYYKEYISKIEKLISGKAKEIYVFYNYETKVEMYYRNQYKDRQTQNIILFRSGPHNCEYVKGMDFADNARALFEYMLSIGINRKYELIWLVKYPEEHAEYEKYDNVSFISYDAPSLKEVSARSEYYRALFLAKFIFFTDAYGFARNCREGQIRVQLWHGCGFKMRLNYVSCEKRYEYMTVTSEIYANIHAQIFGLKKGQMLITGCAKGDWLFIENREKLKGFTIPGAYKYIFWLPTYRFSEKSIEKPRDGDLNLETGLPLISSQEDLIILNEILMFYNMILFIKLHPFQDDKVMHCNGLSNIILLDNDLLIEKDIQVNQLLSMADALISDYSSVAVDYLLLDRPIGFIVDDINSYSLNRGFIFENVLEWLPGKCIFRKEELQDFIKEIAFNIDSDKFKRQKIRNILHKNINGESCKRIIETLGITVK